ncbi:hypothetical protein A6R68_01960, partial [Neotoma lepida]
NPNCGGNLGLLLLLREGLQTAQILFPFPFLRSSRKVKGRIVDRLTSRAQIHGHGGAIILRTHLALALKRASQGERMLQPSLLMQCESSPREEEIPSLFWGLDPVFLAFAKLYIRDILEMKESHQMPGM